MGTQAVMTPADCFARVSLIRREIDDLRAELGRPEQRASTPAIENAEPRACWVAALGLLARADRLAQESGIDAVAAPFSAAPLAATQPADVLALLDAAVSRIGAFKSRIGATDVGPTPAKESTRTPSDVLGAILEANQMLDLLLATPTTPGDVHAEVARASAYASALLAHTGGDEPRRDTVAPRRKRPADCYKKLATCFALATRASRSAGLVPHERKDTPADDVITPSDVRDLAALVTGELAAAHAVAGGPHVPGMAFASLSRKTPADVLHASAHLEAQLTALAKAVEATPLRTR